MFGFTGWFLVFIIVLAIFNAEKLPGLQKELEKKFKVSMDAAKEGTKKAKTKINQVKNDMENKKKSPTKEAEENTPEEIEEALKFMEGHINTASKQKKETVKDNESSKTENVAETKDTGNIN